MLASKPIAAAGHPILCLQLADAYDLGAAFFHWEIATAIAGFFLNIHPFDQPDVEAAKELARQMVAAYQQRGALPSPTPRPRRWPRAIRTSAGYDSGTDI